MGPAWAALALAALSSASCGAALMKLPSGPGSPASDAASALDQATTVCRAVRTLTAEISVSGSAGGRRLRARLSAGVASPDSARLEAVAPFGQPLFIFVATGSDATLVLPRDDRVLEHGRPGAVLEAVAGVPLDANDLRETVTGCGSGASGPAQARRFGDDWRAVPARSGGVLYLHREGTNAPWRLVAADGLAENGRGWRAEYRDFLNDLPRTVRLTGAGPQAFDLQLALSQVEINVPLEAAVFHVQIPGSARPITLDELRRSGPEGIGIDEKHDR